MTIRFFLYFLIVFFFTIHKSNAVQIDISSQEERKIPIAIIFEEFSENSEILKSISKIINDDLKSVGKFIPEIVDFQKELSVKDFFALSENINKSTKQKNDNVLLIFADQKDSKKSSFLIKASLYDVFSGGLVIEKKYSVLKNGTNKVAHLIANAIMFSLFGYEGDFNAKIMYVEEVVSGSGKSRNISVVDRDGKNQKTLVSSSLLMSPTYSISRGAVFYSEFSNGSSSINILDVITGKISSLGGVYQSLAHYKIISPCISLDGKNIVFTIMYDNNINIYNMNFITGQFVKLTSTGINVGPSFSPDGNHIAYTSNIAGKPSIYIMSSNGSNSHRITFEKGHYMEPKWSPNGEWIAFTKLLHNVFSIGIIKPDGSDERILYSDYYADSPAWSPNGMYLAFAFRDKKTKKTKIKIIDLYGNQLRVLEALGKVSDLSWISID